MPSCPICRGTDTHKMDCQNAGYVAKLQAGLRAGTTAITLMTDTLDEQKEAITKLQAENAKLQAELAAVRDEVENKDLLQDARNVIERQREELDKLQAVVGAVKKLPVEDLVNLDFQGEPYLVGYGMMAQGEWSAVLQAIKESE